MGGAVPKWLRLTRVLFARLVEPEVLVPPPTLRMVVAVESSDFGQINGPPILSMTRCEIRN
jgi:hypothetical protein